MEGPRTAEPFVADEREETIEAIWEPVEAPRASMIRRSPQTIEVEPEPVAEKVGPRVTMTHEQYLELDRTLHELYTLVEIAIAQRDEARAEAESAEGARDLYAARLREWKGYAAGLERRLHASQLEELRTAHTAVRAMEIADEALSLGAFAGKRRERLSSKLQKLESELS